MRVSRITGLPNITDGLISMRSIMKTLDAIVAGTLRYPMRLAGILVLTGGDAAMHFIVRFEPLPGKAAAFREELMRVLEPSRAEAGCLSIHIYESVGEPARFAI